ncbi:unnamed protein product [Cuscuta campestris]|uniref:Secreted protein n=1 Tax=Cuscuta campestris TaxID=132261 RepID=A0A484NNC6_9ASTE|nr:unnamed protein product [Cuscuta campestris]
MLLHHLCSPAVCLLHTATSLNSLLQAGDSTTNTQQASPRVFFLTALPSKAFLVARSISLAVHGSSPGKIFLRSGFSHPINGCIDLFSAILAS